MKLVIAIIQPHKLEEVKEELYKVEVNLITVSEVLGHGRQKGVTEIYRGAKETGNLLRKVRLEIAVNDAFLEPTIKAIVSQRLRGRSWERMRSNIVLTDWSPGTGLAAATAAAGWSARR